MPLHLKCAAAALSCTLVFKLVQFLTLFGVTKLVITLSVVTTKIRLRFDSRSTKVITFIKVNSAR